MPENFDVAIIGAGPAGLAAAVNAAKHKLAHVLIERREIGNTVFEYQLKKHVMAEPQRLPLRGALPFEAGTREAVLASWNTALKAQGVNAKTGEVTKIVKSGDIFTVSTKEFSCTAKSVILSIGVQGTPRTLGVPGELLPHVAYTLSDPEAFEGKEILVVGAGDSAIENALGLCDKNSVSIMNRTADFSRAKEANNAKISGAIRSGKIRLFANANVVRVEPETVYLAMPEGEVAVKCNYVIARLGGILPRKFLEGCGIAFTSADQSAIPVVNARYESSVPGLFILGALIGYPLIKQCMNQGFEVIEHIVGNPVEPADQPLVAEKLVALEGTIDERIAWVRKRAPLFAELSDPQFRELLIESTIHLKNPKDIIFERNDYTDTFFSVLSGAVEIAPAEAGKPGVRVGEESYFGEMGLLSGRRRSATVHAAEPAVLLESPRKQILKLISSVPAVKRALDEAFMVRALQSTIFPEAEPAFLRDLSARLQMKNFKKGDVLFREGDPGDMAYVLRKGSVKVSRRSRTGAEVTQTYIAAGNLFGEMALLSPDPQPRSATVGAAVACETIMITKDDFQALLKHSPAIRSRIEQMVRSRQVENITAHQNEYRGQVLDFMMSEGVTDADNFLLIDSDLCVACDNCERACAATHQGYSRLDRKGGKTFACIQIPISCRHCENPLCMLDCPPDALTRMPNGEVIIKDSCIGCGNCTRNCPYGVIQLVYDKKDEGFSLWNMLRGTKADADKGPAKAAKCDMCGHLDGGPACVRSCPTGAAMRVNPRQMLRIIGEKGGRRAV